MLGEEWGKIDVEKAASLKPDLIVADYWPVEEGYSGMEDGVEEKSKKIAELAPVVGAAQGDSIVDLIVGYEKLAEALGADVDGRAGRRGEGRRSRRPATRSARPSQAKPGLTALAISPYDDELRRRRAGVRAGAARPPALGPGRDRPGRSPIPTSRTGRR